MFSKWIGRWDSKASKLYLLWGSNYGIVFFFLLVSFNFLFGVRVLINAVDESLNKKDVKPKWKSFSLSLVSYLFFLEHPVTYEPLSSHEKQDL